jgi:hypothetical protein
MRSWQCARCNTSDTKTSCHLGESRRKQSPSTSLIPCLKSGMDGRDTREISRSHPCTRCMRLCHSTARTATLQPSSAVTVSMRFFKAATACSAGIRSRRHMRRVSKEFTCSKVRRPLGQPGNCRVRGERDVYVRGCFVLTVLRTYSMYHLFNALVYTKRKCRVGIISLAA